MKVFLGIAVLLVVTSGAEAQYLGNYSANQYDPTRPEILPAPAVLTTPMASTTVSAHTAAPPAISP